MGENGPKQRRGNNLDELTYPESYVNLVVFIYKAPRAYSFSNTSLKIFLSNNVLHPSIVC